VGSESLLKRKRIYNSKTFMVNHAADIKHFMKATAPETVVPKDLASIPGRRVGFVGMVDKVRFDFDLIEKLADNSDNQVVIVGGFVDDADRLLPKRDNIHCLGMKSINDLPAYIKGLDVCLMPYRLNDATRNIYPLKLHEYMATGKPVVATPIPAVEEFRDLMYVVDDLAEYSQVVNHAASEKNTDKVERRLACAQDHSWEIHVAEKVNYIEENLV
jgi:glycosyltransferase involved in cell wall biosynthesis